MSATVGIAGAGTFGPMLKEFYQGPVAEQINNRVWMREYFQKRSKGWSGKQMVIPIRAQLLRTLSGQRCCNGHCY